MKCFIPLAAILSVAVAGHSQVAVRLPFLNPAGVTYVSGPAPVGLAAGPAQYNVAAATHYSQPLAYAAGPAYAAPAYHRHSTIHGAPLAYHTAHHAIHPAPIHAAPIHAAPVLQRVVQPVVQPVASLHHVPAVANVPVTHFEATPGVVQKVVDVAHPAVSTRKFHVRRPAIQKQFYDIEERVVVRPAGSALVELDEPLSKVQRGGAVISRAFHHPLPAVRVIPAYKALHTIPTTAALLPVHHAPSAPAPTGPSATGPSATDAYPTDTPTSSQATPSQDSFDDADTVSVGNPEFRSATNDQENQGQEQEQQEQQTQQQQEQQGEQQQDQQQDAMQDQQQQEEQPQQQQQQQSNDQALATFQQRSRPQFQFQASRQFQSEREQFEARQFNFAALAQQQQPQFTPDPIPDRSEQDAAQGRSQDNQGNNGQTEARFQERPLEADGRSVFPSLRNLDAASSQSNQQRLIELLTARGGVAEVGFGRSGPASGQNIEAGGVRARVISATPSPAYADPAGERVSTRRVVVSRPVETLQELDVIEPVTKLQRVAVNTPTLFKTARLGVARVATSVPVLQKTYHAPAALPYYQKTLAHAPALTYY